MNKEQVFENLIIGPAKIEKFLGRSFAECLELKKRGCPIVKRGGYPTLSQLEYKTWAAKYGIADIEPPKVTIGMLKNKGEQIKC